ncbi:MAG TPA: YdiU family protein [Bacillales bacterium]|nr:YdiU family protein [Bacillales bacterium]
MYYEKVEAGWNFDNSYPRLPKMFYSSQNPEPVTAPELVIFNSSLATSLGLNDAVLNNNDEAALFAGNKIPEGAAPLAQAYAGHQFGHFTMLGDGRAVLLGEHLSPNDERFDIQLKGSGRTPYSRGGDGRAVLGPMLREYIISEAMHALGIPTTRSLAVVKTGELVFRETALPGAIVTRVASSHIRVGTFEFAANFGTDEDVRALADYTLQRHFSGADFDTSTQSNTGLGATSDADRYLFLLQEVSKRQAELIAKWQLVGFIHGVMNTDNMAISGETIDYGPCAFMDTYDPATVFSSIDRQGRYAYGNQPPIGGWNLARFAETLLSLLHDDEDQAVQLAQEAISEYPKLFHKHWLSGMRAKLGLYNEEDQDESLIEDLLSLMKKNRADFTNTFRALTMNRIVDTGLTGVIRFDKWYEEWEARRGRQLQSRSDSQKLMQHSNPAVIPRNHRVEESLEAAVEHGDYTVMHRLLEVLSDPYAYSPDQDEYCELPVSTTEPYRTFCGT